MRKNEIYLFLAWVLSLVSTLTSLFFSLFLHLPPCNLCWYQRICMFPLVLVLGVGFSTQDRRNHLYSLPLVILGWLLATYHNLLYYKWIPETLSPCSAGASCTERQLEIWGFVGIPLMSWLAFSGLGILLALHLKQRGTLHEKK
jgi:disulfide bond formation protein DsbB